MSGPLDEEWREFCAACTHMPVALSSADRRKLFFAGAAAAIALLDKGRGTLKALHAELVDFEDELDREGVLQ